MRALTIIFCVTAGLVISLTPTARASFVIQNPSFESPVEGSGGIATVVPTNWSPATDPSGNVRVIDKNFNSGNTVPGNATGNQAAIIGANTNGVTDLYQSIGTSGGLTSLTLTVDAAQRVDASVFSIFADSFTLGIWQDTDNNGIPDSPLATVVVPAGSLIGSFQPFSVTALSVPAGELYVRFTAAVNSGTLKQTLLDNASLDEGPAPEPASMALLLLGGAALLGRRRRA